MFGVAVEGHVAHLVRHFVLDGMVILHERRQTAVHHEQYTVVPRQLPVRLDRSRPDGVIRIHLC